MSQVTFLNRFNLNFNNKNQKLAGQQKHFNTKIPKNS